MGKIRLTVNDTIVNGKQISFLAPCSSMDATGLIIGEDDYDIVNSIGTSVLGVKNVWAADVIISVILNTETKKAYIQNQNYDPSVMETISASEFFAVFPKGFTATGSIKKSGHMIYGGFEIAPEEGSGKTMSDFGLLTIRSTYAPVALYSKFNVFIVDGEDIQLEDSAFAYCIAIGKGYSSPIGIMGITDKTTGVYISINYMSYN